MKHIKLFENFSRDYLKQNNNSLTAFYSGKLSSFNLEAKVLDLLAEFESQVDSTFSDKWDLNRGRNYGRYNGDYFSLNVKVYKWPNPDNIKKKFGIEMDDERLSDIWYRWLSQEAEFFEEDLKEQYSWIDNISWGGNSGGWLHIYPDKGADSLLEAAEEEIQMYLDIKEFYDEVELEEVGKAINNPEWERLAELGLVEDAEEIRKIVEGLTGIINWLKTEINNLINIERDLVAIKERHKKFENRADEYFMDYLKDEIENGYLSESHKFYEIVQEGFPESSPGLCIKAMVDGSEVGRVMLISLDEGQKENFDIDLHNFLKDQATPFNNENSYYRHSLEVDENYRRMGIGRTLLIESQEYSAKTNKKYITSVISKDNLASHNLSTSLGGKVYRTNGIKDLLYKEI